VKQSSKRNKPNYIIYAESVLSGEIPACKFVKQACKRFFKDLENPAFEFKAGCVESVLIYFSSIKHSKGKWKGNPFIPEPWQEFILANIFGFYHKGGNRRFTKSYLEMPKKNGKSPFAAAVAGYFLVYDGEETPEVYSIATELPQASISWEYAANMLEVLDESEGIGISVKRGENNRRILIDEGRNGIFSPLSFGDNERHDGKSVSFGLVDEYHAHKSSRGYGILADGIGARDNPHIMVITTAGFNRVSACYEMREHCQKILTGELVDDSQFSIIYTIDEGDDWTSEETWMKANPNFEISVSKKSFEDSLVLAKENPSEAQAFKTKKLNMWLDSLTTWLPDDLIELGNVGFVPTDGDSCTIGFDLGVTDDFACLCFDFEKDGIHNFVNKYYCPAEKLRNWRGTIGVNLRKWASDGWITVTERDTTDEELIHKDIMEFNSKYHIISMGYDPYNTKRYGETLREKHDINAREFAQDIRNISFPTKALAKLIKEKKFRYDGNPVTRWMFGNAQVYTDANLNIKILKSIKGQGNKDKKVDGVIAMIMAYGEAIDENKEDNWWFEPSVV
jgi:phage terminase large subunit-like protein